MCCQMNTSLLRDTMAEIADCTIEFVYCFGLLLILRHTQYVDM